MASATELVLKYDSIPLSKRLEMVGTTGMTKNNKVEDDIPESWAQIVDIVDPETEFTPLMISCQNGTLSTVRTLISRGAKIDYKTTALGLSPLIVASKGVSKDIRD
jgi:hypothetical protein